MASGPTVRQGPINSNRDTTETYRDIGSVLRHYRDIPSPSTGCPQPVHRLSKQRAVIPQDRLRGVVAGRAGDAAAGMGAGAAVIEPLQRPAIVGVSEHRPGREQ